MDKVLVDTDVIMDFFFDRKPFAQFAIELMNLCANKEIQGYTTPIIISNVYYLLRKTATHEIIVEKLKQLLLILEIVSVDKKIVLNALNSDFKDLEDALQNFSAVETAQIKIIITRNLRDFKKSELAVMTPETYMNGRM